MYGKIENGSLTTSGSVLYTEIEQIFNAKEEMWLSHGWKKIVYEEYKSEEALPVYTENEKEIIVTWEY